jgi:hydroxyacid-oxoacid transhydrogenase
MVCCHPYVLAAGSEHAFAVDPTSITFGSGVLDEVGDWCRALEVRRALLMTDETVGKLQHVARAKDSLARAGVDLEIYDRVEVEPTDRSFEAAARVMREGRFDGIVSVGGGSVIDTAKAANLFATHPAPFLAYVNAPVGEGRAVPGPLKPHLACPTTSGTGSECTGIAVCDVLSLHAKTGIAHRYLKPTRALIDPDTTRTLPSEVVAASGFDVLSHALESFTARPYTSRVPAASAPLRPMSQGANPWSDMGCREALRLCGKYLVRAVADANDREARENMMWAATLAGIAFGNAGVHVPHGMAYPVAGMVRDYRCNGYPDAPLVPHGMSVILNAPAVFRATASISPDRHLEGAQLLGADAWGAAASDAGEVLSTQLVSMMKACRMPNGLGAIGYGADDVPALTEGAIVQKRLLDNAPLPVTRELLASLYQSAMTCW